MALNWNCMLDALDEMIGSRDFYWAVDTIETIREWVDQNKRVTAGQICAIDNIRDAKYWEAF